MTDKILKVLNAFYAAKRVNHYYHMHTNGDDHLNRRVSIENIQKIISVLTGFSIEKCLVSQSSEFHRAFVERFDNGKRNIIYVMEAESSSWRRFSAVKELCHLLVDASEDFQSDPCVTIDGMKSEHGYFDDHSAPESDSEHLAEIIAMELIYPLEHRREDRERQAQGKTLEEIAADRDVPTKYVSHGVSDAYYESCINIWKSLKEVDPPNLDDAF